jgi:hypothetical protein
VSIVRKNKSLRKENWMDLSVAGSAENRWGEIGEEEQHSILTNVFQVTLDRTSPGLTYLPQLAQQLNSVSGIVQALGGRVSARYYWRYLLLNSVCGCTVGWRVPS